MKVSVITLHTVSNYGSALQTYATQKIIEDMGHTVEFVDYCRPQTLPKNNVERILNGRIMTKLKFIWGVNDFTYQFTKSLLTYYLERKKNIINKFIEKNIHLTKTKYFSLEELKKNPPCADIYVTGSDQVWNSIWNSGIDKAFFLDYAKPGKLRIAFAASIGRTSFDNEEAAETKQLLEKYDYISMREKSGVELLSDIGIESQLILDPTLMLDKYSWKAFAKDIKEKEKYLLVYQLNLNTQMDEYAEKLAKKKKWKIIRISYGTSEKQKSGKCIVKPTVERFLGCFVNAACVLTDSFHAIAFSLNLGVDFISVLPPQFSVRITDILRLTKTEFRILNDYSDYDIADRKIDKAAVDKILEKERERGYSFLKMAFDEGDHN